MTTFFTSDNHFGHKNIHRFCPATRPHSDVAVMDEMMVLRWNNQVQRGDTVWMLGDVFFHGEDKALSIMRRLNGDKHLVYGNHDKVIRNSARLRAYFGSIHEAKELKLDGERITLFHYPIHEWNKIHHGAFHFHGHIHQRLSGVPGRILNVCLDSPTFGDGAYSLYRWEDLRRAALALPVRQHHDRSDE